jgi:hypothetical protein
MSLIYTPKIVMLDTCQLNWWAKARACKSPEYEQWRIVERAIKDARFFLFLTVEHLIEICAHDDDRTLEDRVQLFESIPQFVTPNSLGRDMIGSLNTVYEVEAKFLIEGRQGADLIANVRSNGFNWNANLRGVFNDRKYLAEMREIAREHTTNSQQEVAVLRMPNLMKTDDKILESFANGYRSDAERRQILFLFGALAARHASDYGDKRIDKPEAIGIKFLDVLLHEERRLKGKDLIRTYLEEAEIPPEMITEETTHKQFCEMSEAGHRAKSISREIGCDPAHLLEKLYNFHSPSYNIIRGIEDYRDIKQRSSGGAIFDRNFVSISPYVDTVFADKQTVDMVRRASKSKHFENAIGHVEPAKNGTAPTALIAA